MHSKSFLNLDISVILFLHYLFENIKKVKWWIKNLQKCNVATTEGILQHKLILFFFFFLVAVSTIQKWISKENLSG